MTTKFRTRGWASPVRKTTDSEPFQGTQPAVPEVGDDVGAESWNGPHKTGYSIKSGDDEPTTLVIHGKHEFVHDEHGTHLVTHDGKRIATFRDCHAQRDDDGTLHIHHGTHDQRTHDGLRSTTQHNDVARIRDLQRRNNEFWSKNEQ
jgi:hypothetical protein